MSYTTETNLDSKTEFMIYRGDDDTKNNTIRKCQ